MIRLMLALFAFMWSAVLDTEGQAGGGDLPGDDAPEKFELTADELTARTNAAAEARAQELAGVLGVDLSNPADVKALIEAGRKAQEAESGSGDDGGDSGDSSEGGDIKDQIKAVLDEVLNPITERLGKIEGTEEQRQQQQRQQTLTEGVDAALKAANVREDRLEAARVVALANGAKLNERGELEGSKEAIEATKKALPEAFRGDGDDGKAADANKGSDGKRKPRTLSEALTAHYSSSKS